MQFLESFPISNTHRSTQKDGHLWIGNSHSPGAPYSSYTWKYTKECSPMKSNRNLPDTKLLIPWLWISHPLWCQLRLISIIKYDNLGNSNNIIEFDLNMHWNITITDLFPQNYSLFTVAPLLTTYQIQNTMECIQSLYYSAFFRWASHYSINITYLKGHQLFFMLLFILTWSNGYIRIIAFTRLLVISRFT